MTEPEPEPDPRSLGEVAVQHQLFCIHPHGIFTVGAMQLLEHRPDVRLLSSPYLYHFAPVFRGLAELLLGLKMGSVSHSDLHRLMKKGESPLALVPGGFHEATLTCPGHERVFLRSRRGFVKYALRHGYDLVPVYTIGENDLMANPQGGWRWRFWLNGFGLPTVLPWGSPLLPLLPRRGVALVTAVGPPVRMPHIAEPTDEDVAKHHARYVVALRQLYARMVPGTASEGRPLEIW